MLQQESSSLSQEFLKKVKRLERTVDGLRVENEQLCHAAYERHSMRHSTASTRASEASPPLGRLSASRRLARAAVVARMLTASSRANRDSSTSDGSASEAEGEGGQGTGQESPEGAGEEPVGKGQA